MIDPIKNTFIYPKNEDVEIEVGDIKQPDFKPRMKIKRWDNEVNFSVGLISDHKGTHIKDVNNKCIWDDDHGTKAHFYQKASDEFEFEIVLDEKPPSNVITLSIETKGLDFFYQPPLTQKDIDGGCERPENIVGSYAVYHKTMTGNYIDGKNYRAGKAFHIYRPDAIDNSGLKVWCDLYIGKDMQITIPQDFIDNAVYPVVIDPTFGCSPSAPGGSWQWADTDEASGSYHSTPANIDTAQKFTAYVKTYTSTSYIKAMFVLQSDLTLIANGIGGVSASFTTSAGWVDSVFGTDPSPTTSTDHYLMVIGTNDGSYNGYYVAYDSGSEIGGQDGTNSYASPVDLGSVSSQMFEYSVYCTYTTTGAGATPKGRTFYGPFRGPFGGPIG